MFCCCCNHCAIMFCCFSITEVTFVLCVWTPLEENTIVAVVVVGSTQQVQVALVINPF